MKAHLFISFLFSLFFFSHTATAEPALNFKDAWIAEAPPVSKIMAAYVKIKNPAIDDINIVSATSDSFERIEFHQTQYQGNMAQMQHLHSLTVPANGELELKAGGHHLMLFNPVRKLKSGDKVNFSFKLENNDIIEVVAEVKKQAMDTQSHDHHSHQHH